MVRVNTSGSDLARRDVAAESEGGERVFQWGGLGATFVCGPRRRSVWVPALEARCVVPSGGVYFLRARLEAVETFMTEEETVNADVVANTDPDLAID
ncbi:hypothetical protein HK405_014571, partial [Cladochytrium tenue]